MCGQVLYPPIIQYAKPLGAARYKSFDVTYAAPHKWHRILCSNRTNSKNSNIGATYVTLVLPGTSCAVIWKQLTELIRKTVAAEI